MLSCRDSHLVFAMRQPALTATNFRAFQTLLGLLAASFSQVLLAANTFTPLGGSCGVINANRQFAITTTAAVAANRAVVISVAQTGFVVSDIKITDAIASNYRAIGAYFSSVEGVSVAQLLAKTSASLPAGSVLTLSAGAVTPGNSICVQTAAYSDIAGSGLALDSSGTARSVAANVHNVSLSGPASRADAAIWASFAFVGQPGTVSAGINTLPVICASSGGLCLLNLQTNSTGSSGAQPLSVSTAAALSSIAVHSALVPETILVNGFE